MAVTLSLFAGVGAQFFDNNGNPLVGGKIYSYYAGTTSPLATYTTDTGAAAHTNPIILDSAGRVPSGGEIWLSTGIGYKFIVKTSADVTVSTYDNIPSSAQPPAANNADSIMYEQGYVATAGNFVPGLTYKIVAVGTTNFTLIGATSNTPGLYFIATGAGTGTGTAELSQTVEAKLRETVSVKDFGAIGDGVADDTVAIQAALTAASNNSVIFFPQGRYKVTSPLVMAAGKTWQSLQGTSAPFSAGGPSSTTLSNIFFSGLAAGAIGITTNTYASIENLGIFGPGASAGGTTRGVSVSSEIRLTNCAIQDWDTGLYIRTSYYSRLLNVGFRYNALAVNAANCFTLDIQDISVSGLRKAGQPSGNGIFLGGATSCNIRGGSLETYYGSGGYAIELRGNLITANVDGVYFEPYGDASNTAPAAISVVGRGACLTVYGCTAYTYYQDYFVNVDSNASEYSITAFNNQFVNTSPFVSTIYKLATTTTALSTSTVNIRNDNLYGSTTKPVYINPALDGTLPGKQNINVQPPGQGTTPATLADHEFLGRPQANVSLSVVPSDPIKGTLYWADGSGWNPFKSQFTPYPVVYDGTNFRQIAPPQNLTSFNNVSGTLIANENALCLTGSSAITIDLPAAPLDGDTHIIKQGGGVNAVTIDGNGKLFETALSTYTLAGASFECVTVVFSLVANRWLILAKA